MPPKPWSKFENSFRAWLCHGKYHSPQRLCEVTVTGKVPFVPRYGLPENQVLLSLKVRLRQLGEATAAGNGFVPTCQEPWSAQLNRRSSVWPETSGAPKSSDDASC